MGISLSAIYGMDNKEYLIDHGFINENQEDLSKSITSEFNILPKPTGLYQIGVKIYDLIDENRDNRLIPVWIFFPTKKGIHNAYPKISENRALDLWEAINLWNQLEVNVYSSLIDDLDFLKNSSKHPVIFFNNGNGMLCSDNAFLLEDLTSHGYIVVSIQNQINIDKLVSAKFTKGSFENYNTVIRNNLYVFDWLKSNNKTTFYNALDLSRIGVIGYSMGANSLMLWADKASRDSTKNHFLFPHETSNAKECIVSLDARRIAFPFINNTPIFMLISSKRKDEQILNGEYELMQKIDHRFKYYSNTHHGSFSDQAYFNIQSPLSSEMGWYYGSSEERMQFFDEMRKDIRDFLEKKIGKFSNLDDQTITQEDEDRDIPNHLKYQVPHILQNDDYSCATTSLAMAITYLENLDKPLDKEFVWKISGTDQKDVHKYGNDMEGLKRIANHFGYKSEFLEYMNISDIEHLLSKKALVIPCITTDNKTLATHSFLVIGYDREGKMLYINDPANKVAELKYSDFETLWASSFLSSPRKKVNKSAFVIYLKN